MYLDNSIFWYLFLLNRFDYFKYVFLWYKIYPNQLWSLYIFFVNVNWKFFILSRICIFFLLCSHYYFTVFSIGIVSLFYSVFRFFQIVFAILIYLILNFVFSIGIVSLYYSVFRFFPIVFAILIYLILNFCNLGFIIEYYNSVYSHA